MRTEILVFATVLACGLAPLAASKRRRRAPLVLGATALALVAGGLGRVFPAFETEPRASDAHRPQQIPEAGYVSSDSCRACHPRQYATWRHSYHRTMTQVAEPESVIGSFDTTLDHDGGRYRLAHDGSEYSVEMDLPLRGRPGESLRVEKPIVLTTGSHHMQVYWYATERSRELVALPFAYLVADRRWVPRVSIFLAPPEIRWGMELGAWNATCIKCHTTHGRPRIRGIGEVDSRVSEFGIACEACHGPAAEHVRVNRDPRRRYELHRAAAADPTVVQPARLAGRPSSQVCGQCHAVTLFRDRDDDTDFREHGFAYRPGDDLSRTRLVVRPGADPDDPDSRALALNHPEFRAENQFWSDGQVRVSGREFSGLVESPCYAGGKFNCLSCHTMHKPDDDPRSLDEWADDQLIRGMDGDEACLQCHGEYRRDLARHTFHKPESSGSRCYNCHNPYTTYGLLKAIRSHQVSNPTVAESVATGRPNACNQCHLDKTLAWTADYLEKWYRTPAPASSERERTVAASVLWTLEGDAGQRALMAWSFGWDAARAASGSTWTLPYLAQLMMDPYHAVRYIAGRSLRRIEGFADFEYDHMAPAAELGLANRRLLDAWQALRAARTGDELLIGTDGRVDLGRYVELLGSRDNRAMILAE